MKLELWMKCKRLKQTELAALLGTGKARAHRIVKGKIIPKAPEMNIIFNLTHGQVTPNDFYDIAAPAAGGDSNPSAGAE